VADVVSLDAKDLQAHFHAEGWTDGLPIIPPTPDLVDEMLAGGGLAEDEILGTVPQRELLMSASHAAANAVMAGCEPEYFPIVAAALSATLDPVFNVDVVGSSTGGAAVAIAVSGPLAESIGMNHGHSALAPGNHANATIGRAVRLALVNFLGHRPRGTDGTSLGHPGRYTLAFAEGPAPAGWGTLRAELGFDASDTTVTVLAADGPRQLANHLSERPEDLAATVAAAVKSPWQFIAGKGGAQVMVVLGPEHAAALAAGGWSRRDLQEFVCRESRVSPAELAAVGVPLEQGSQHAIEVDADGQLVTIAEPADVLVITAGGEGAGWSSLIPCWAPKLHSRSVTRRVRPAGEALPDCGPDSCEVVLPPAAHA
jgi:hypothetical protein